MASERSNGRAEDLDWATARAGGGRFARLLRPLLRLRLFYKLIIANVAILLAAVLIAGMRVDVLSSRANRAVALKSESNSPSMERQHMSDTIRVLLVDDHAVLRSGLRRCWTRKTTWSW